MPPIAITQSAVKVLSVNDLAMLGDYVSATVQLRFLISDRPISYTDIIIYFICGICKHLKSMQMQLIVLLQWVAPHSVSAFNETKAVCFDFDDTPFVQAADCLLECSLTHAEHFSDQLSI
jgi:hypothetical protein